MKKTAVSASIAFSLLTATASAAMTITSADIRTGLAIPVAHIYPRCGGDNVSPNISWSGAPRGTLSFVLTMIDLDVKPDEWSHWVVVGLPATLTSLPRGVQTLPGGAKAIVSNFGDAAYAGPCPPKGTGVHHYQFTIWALPTATLSLPPDEKATTLTALLSKQALDRASLVGLVSAPNAASAQVTLPDTPAGVTMSAWLEAFNSGDRARLDDYYKKYDPEKHADDIMDFRARVGGFELVSVEQSEPLRIVLLLKERNSAMRALAKLQVSNSDPPRVTSSEVNGIAPGAAVIGYDIDAATRARVIDAAIAKIDEFYVFPEVAKKMAMAVRARAKRGEYDAITDGNAFANLLTQNFRDVSHDKHLFVTFSPVRLPEETSSRSPDDVARFRLAMQQANCGFEKVEHLGGNVGYVKFNFFADPEVCGATAIAAMNFLANVDAVIFDLRQNGGGDPKMVALISTYFFATQTHLNDLWERKSGETQQYWTLPYVPGKPLPTVPVFVLTSHRTFSGGEEFSNNLKVLKRATIVGEVTGGGAHPVTGHRIDDRFTIGVPFARAINPTTKTNWEGVGVEPDVKVPADDALTTAQALAAKELASRRASQP